MSLKRKQAGSPSTDGHRTLWRLPALVGAVAVALIASMIESRPTPAQAANVEQLRQQVAAAEAEAGQLKEALSAARQRMFDAEAEAAEAQGELERIEGRLAMGRERTQALAAEVVAAKRQLGQERERLRRSRKILADRLVSIYIAGPVEPGEVAIGATDFGGFLVGAEYMAAIQGADARLANRVEQVRTRVAEEHAALEKRKTAAERFEATLARDRDRIGEVSLAAERRAASLRAAAAQRDAALSDLQGKMASWVKAIERAERRAARRAQRESSATEAVDRWLGGPYSIPTAIVMCESGGNYSALNPSSGAGGAYQIIPSTWKAYGGKGLAHEAPKSEQDRIAALIWADSGPNAWVCKG